MAVFFSFCCMGKEKEERDPVQLNGVHLDPFFRWYWFIFEGKLDSLLFEYREKFL
jgi:hypothetical protein